MVPGVRCEDRRRTSVIGAASDSGVVSSSSASMPARSIRRRRPMSGIRTDWVASAIRRSSIARAGQPVAWVASCSSTEKEPLRLRSAIASAT